MAEQEITLVTGWNPFCVQVNDGRTLGEIFGPLSWFYAIFYYDTTLQEWVGLGPEEYLKKGQSYWVDYTPTEPTTLRLYDSSNKIVPIACVGMVVVGSIVSAIS